MMPSEFMERLMSAKKGDPVELRLAKAFGERQSRKMHRWLDEGKLDEMFGSEVAERIRQIASGQYSVISRYWLSATVRSRYFGKSASTPGVALLTWLNKSLM